MSNVLIACFKDVYAVLLLGQWLTLSKGDRVLNGLGMALNGIVLTLYVVDIQYYTIISETWGIGRGNCKNRDNANYPN
jgi:hypothetical protein